MVFCTWLCKGTFFLLPFPIPFFLSSPLYDIEWPVPPALPLAPTPMLLARDKVERVWWPLACLLLGSLHLSLDLATPQCSYGVWQRDQLPQTHVTTAITDYSLFPPWGVPSDIHGPNQGSFCRSSRQDCRSGYMMGWVHSDDLEMTRSYSVFQIVCLFVSVGITSPVG